jgi:hypothetical protein
MAIDKSVHCRVCKQHKSVTCAVSSYPTICDDCARTEAGKDKAAYVDGIVELPPADAIRRLAAEVYLLKKSHADYGDHIIG